MLSWRLIFVLFPSFAFLSCLKKDTGCSYRIENTKAPVAEQQALLSYLTSNSITAVKDSSGLYYQVTSAGTGTSPNLCSTIQINYSGKLVNGSVFDARDNTVFVLGTLIDGWKIGIPLIKKGGQVRLFIPPSLGYGSSDVRDQSGRVVIPGNSILIFDITLLDFQ